MKLRPLIFLTLLLLGVLPILSLVTINLADHIERHEKTSRQQTQVQAEKDFELLAAHVKKVRNHFDHATSLLAESAAPVAATDCYNGHQLALLRQWFADAPEISGFELLDRNGIPQIVLERNGADSFHELPDRASRANKIWFQDGLGLDTGELEARLLKKHSAHAGDDQHVILLVTPITGHGGQQPLRLVVLTIDLSLFLHNYANSFWITEDGAYLHRAPSPELELASFRADSATLYPEPVNAFYDFIGLKKQLLNDGPLIWSQGEVQKMIWLPLSFADSGMAALWIGTPIDRTGVEQWKKTLIVNILWIVFSLILIVLFIAHMLTTKADRIKEDILQGLEVILREEKEVDFHWSGPEELATLGRELTLLSRRYALTSEARRNAEAALSESEDRFRNLTASAQDAITMMDHHGNISFWNKAACDIFGYSPGEALGKPLHALISPRLPPGFDSETSIHSRPVSDGPIRETMELLATCKDGAERPIELSLSEARIKDKWHSMWIIRDISERKRADEKARQQQQQLIQADKMISLGLLIAGVAHEINNPNSIAMLNTAMLAKSWESAKPILEEYFRENGDFLMGGIEFSEMRLQIPRLFAELEESSRRIRNIVQDLKNYSRQDSSEHTANVDLNDIVQAAVRLTHNQIKKAAGRFELILADQLPTIRGNRQRLEQVVINLIQNSCEALQDTAGSIMINTAHDPAKQTVSITVTDTGVGIPPQDLNKIADPFFTTKRSAGGTGLGLSVSAGIIKEHQGIMQFTSEPERGTTAVVTFPAELS